MLPANIAVLDASGRILSVNDEWKTFGQENGLRITNYAVGSSYLEFCQDNDPNASLFATHLTELLAGSRDVLIHIYPCHSPTQPRWFCAVGVPLSLHQPTGVALLHIDLTAMLPPAFGSDWASHQHKRKNAAGSKKRLNPIGKAVLSTARKLLSENAQLFNFDAWDIHEMSSKYSNNNCGSPKMMTPLDVSDRLTNGQVKVLSLLAEGKSNKDIARELQRSPNTVKLHVSAILRQLKLKSRTEAAIYASKLYDNPFKLS